METLMSQHECPVISIKLERHPDADSLSLIKYNGFTLVVKTSDWENESIGVHIPEDYVVPDTEQFKFLGDNKRIKPRKFRGIWSDGIMIKAPPGSVVGQNAMYELGIKRYEPEMEVTFNGDNESGPPGYYPKYDVEGYKKYADWFHTNIYNTELGIYQNEIVVCTEKIHGANARFVWQDNRMWCGSRTNWKALSEKDPWWKALSQNPWIEVWCRENPELVLYGEIFGQVQNLKYGCETNQIRFAVFDILSGRTWLNHDEARDLGPELFWVPEIYRGPLDLDKILELIEKDSVVGGSGHLMEGCVISPIIDRETEKGDRVKLKLVSKRYFEKNGY